MSCFGVGEGEGMKEKRGKKKKEKEGLKGMKTKKKSVGK